MTARHSRTGSALLIVLGMMAFMIVSAVAFSGYMRYARLPSSYLRRTSASRHLAKAGVARAIDTLDRALCNNPHPGIGGQSIGGPNRNVWNSRIFTATNTLVGLNETAPVLTLEGLAYIPPPLVNAARYYSRRSAAAQWQSFGFDTGRFAFCAIDVSDYFDVNRMVANTARSSMPQRRVSLSYLFEGAGHVSAGNGGEAWDTFMDKFRSVNDDTLEVTFGSKVPLVSVADLNLAMGMGDYGGLQSPFCRYLRSSGGQGFYNTGSEEDEERIRRMTFVTDGWFPKSDDAEEEEDRDAQEQSPYAGDIYDLTEGRNQPFSALLSGQASGPRSMNTTTILGIMSDASRAKVRLLDSMPVLGLVALYDYLDKDHVPVSLACPTLERAPMCTALKPNFNGQFKVTEKSDGSIRADAKDEAVALKNDVKTTNTRDVFQKVQYFIDGSTFAGAFSGSLETLLVYPFAHEDGVNETFNVDGRVTVFFTLTDDPVTLRSGTADGEILHLNKKDFSKETPGLNDNGTVTIPLSSMPFQRPSYKVKMTEEDVCKAQPFVVRGMVAAPTMNKHPLMEIWYKWSQTWNDDAGRYDNQTRPENAEVARAHCGVPPLNSKGEIDKTFTDDDAFTAKVKAGGAGAKMCVALHVRIADSQNKTVDLVPAHMKDDQTFNTINNYTGFPNANTVCGQRWPVMRFDTGVQFSYSKSGMEDLAKGEKTIEMTPKAVMVKDPRYNYAPESWYAADAIDVQTWLDQNDSASRAGDIFMATSDQGYLQSIYELAFLPRFSDLTSVGQNGPIMGNLSSVPQTSPAGFASRGTELNEHMMWRTYNPFGKNADDFEGMGFCSTGPGYKVNPYSDSTNIIMAAFANTPIDWRMASTNNSEVELETMSASKFNPEYAWNQYSTGARITYRNLEAIAGRFIERVCPLGNRNGIGGGYTNWLTAWRDLGWDDGDPERFCGVTLDGETSEIWGVDRKFLYGFWRDCFAVKQQLFLVFVRAEPMMMGGGMVGQIPPQLGARAVALVWRDPRSTKSSATVAEGSVQGYPHQTRILFYRQLE